MADKKTTLAEIAQQLGISKITVSRALKGQPGVGDTLRKHVCDVAEELGYEQQRLRTPARRRRFVFITPKRFFLATDSFYHVIYYDLATLCHAHDTDLQVLILEKDQESSGTLPTELVGADGIFIGGEIAKPAMDAVARTGIPVVVIDYYVTDEAVDCVVIDNYMVGAVAAEYLVRKGYRKIGFVGSYQQSSNIADRINGYLKIVRREGLPFQDDWIINNYDPKMDNYILDISLPEEMPQAFICHCDRAAYYFIEKLKSMNIQIPEQVAIISIDNTDLAQACTPPLSSINIDKQAFATQAFHLLEERLKERHVARKVYLETEIIPRASAPGI
ncbi:MAG: LacI family DNA-binding transcriptional regulator [Sphaerochaeta sp.]|jgi:LacI family transcriptional regulator|nr:LacI family DNA-binding transcriptional regulator [Sphaerochaeta sp.]MCH3920178.1 LacI family DNA-binding transcriptional regulator [Sphaerochaeta sp.]MCI2045743.1 LacI family DNA-binding transcriptional regulator [Sphaerochaeta sp.]MCI2076945.1 LacI family DNA-binding transcriptional regulator [Sphaerochaeta sp.]MCI2096779.1 LacI family DNA-binding transcriptional regulator [Sphaerochaeta sp.]